jgi:hypothetical protein
MQRHGQTLGAERFQKELLAQFAAAHRSAEQQRLVSLRPNSRSLAQIRRRSVTISRTEESVG